MKLYPLALISSHISQLVHRMIFYYAPATIFPPSGKRSQYRARFATIIKSHRFIRTCMSDRRIRRNFGKITGRERRRADTRRRFTVQLWSPRISIVYCRKIYAISFPIPTRIIKWERRFIALWPRQKINISGIRAGRDRDIGDATKRIAI